MKAPARPPKTDKAENAVIEKSPPTVLDRIEQVAKIVATVALPLIVAIGGWIIQTAIEDDKRQAAAIQANQQRVLDQQRVSLEFVKIAMGILTSESAKIPKELTRWSWLLLNDQSPKKFDLWRRRLTPKTSAASWAFTAQPSPGAPRPAVMQATGRDSPSALHGHRQRA
jgi:hypothetical protein